MYIYVCIYIYIYIYIYILDSVNFFIFCTTAKIGNVMVSMLCILVLLISYILC